MLNLQRVIYIHTDNDRPILVNDADFLSIARPGHSLHGRFLPIVGHFLEPRALVHHPNHDDAILVGGGQFLLDLIPCDHVDGGFVSLQGLIHRQIARLQRFACLCCAGRSLFQLEHLKQPILSPDGDVSLLFAPCDTVEAGIVWDSDL